jgi:DNA-binding NarL/FixJ family response regulator
MPIQVVLADDHELILEGLSSLFRHQREMEVVARCRDGEEALREVRGRRPDILILDVRMPRLDGLQVLHAMKAEGLSTRAVLLTAAVDDDQVCQAVRLGARGVVLKDMAPRLLLECIREVHGGGYWVERHSASQALTRLLRRTEAATDLARLLTPREMEIVRLVARGLRNKEIASRLSITEGTVKVHLHNTYEKLGLGGRLELTLYAQDKGLL